MKKSISILLHSSRETLFLRLIWGKIFFFSALGKSLDNGKIDSFSSSTLPFSLQRVSVGLIDNYYSLYLMAP